MRQERSDFVYAEGVSPNRPTKLVLAGRPRLAPRCKAGCEELSGPWLSGEKRKSFQREPIDAPGAPSAFFTWITPAQSVLAGIERIPTEREAFVAAPPPAEQRFV